MSYFLPSPKRVLYGAACLVAVCLMAACAAPKPPPPAAPPALAPPVELPPPMAPPPPAPEAAEVLVPVAPQEVPTFEDDLDYQGLAQALERSIEYYKQCGRTFEIGGRKLSGAEMAAGLQAFASLIERRPTTQELNQAIRTQFDVYATVANDAEGGVLFTGYYEPEIEASRTKTDLFRWPIYKRPPDLVDVDLGLFRQSLAGEHISARIKDQKVLPYYSRADIDRRDCLQGQVGELCWAKNPVDVFFLQIQGSGRVRFRDGTQALVHFAGSNGRAFRSVGRLLVQEGRLPKGGVSMQAIRRYLEQHPDEAAAVLDHNESYVFFEEVPEGPLGNIGVLLTAGRSIATDYRLFPGGALAWVETRRPIIRGGRIIIWRKFGRFVLNQDTGGVICGPGRVDFFWGAGPEAALAAGGMCERGRLYFLVKKRILPALCATPAPKAGSGDGRGKLAAKPDNE